MQCTYTKWTGTEGTTEFSYAYGLFFGGLVQLLAGMWGVSAHIFCAVPARPFPVIVLLAFTLVEYLPLCMRVSYSLCMHACAKGCIQAAGLSWLYSSCDAWVLVCSDLAQQYLCWNRFQLLWRLLDGLWYFWHSGLGAFMPPLLLAYTNTVLAGLRCITRCRFQMATSSWLFMQAVHAHLHTSLSSQ